MKMEAVFCDPCSAPRFWIQFPHAKSIMRAALAGQSGFISILDWASQRNCMAKGTMSPCLLFCRIKLFAWLAVRIKARASKAAIARRTKLVWVVTLGHLLRAASRGPAVAASAAGSSVSAHMILRLIVDPLSAAGLACGLSDAAGDESPVAMPERRAPASQNH